MCIILAFPKKRLPNLVDFLSSPFRKGHTTGEPRCLTHTLALSTPRTHTHHLRTRSVRCAPTRPPALKQPSREHLHTHTRTPLSSPRIAAGSTGRRPPRAPHWHRAHTHTNLHRECFRDEPSSPRKPHRRHATFARPAPSPSLWLSVPMDVAPLSRPVPSPTVRSAPGSSSGDAASSCGAAQPMGVSTTDFGRYAPCEELHDAGREQPAFAADAVTTR
ncbi:hypothetical protein PVAP13_6NG002300 [Panicum virgatum]|uniref:Uncharacterized protein n=1 Tax=Panicum virgatum TaxID=38727 RepID=A0A8T0QS31_PANVG|nr:hypothetical protein PVAP13_6NG002300 [Panicum virgatum]